jgi:exonuclease SbcC
VDAQEQHVDSLRAQVERQRAALSEAERRHADLVSQKTQARPRLERLVKSQDAASQALQAVLVTLELDSVTALQASRLEPSTLVSLRARQDAISTRLAEASSSVKTCQEALDAHQARRPKSLSDDASADTVQAQFDSAEAALQTAAESLRETDRQLAVYRDEIKKKAEAKAALEQAITDSQIWMDLNKLIGQRDGERFKLFAQALNLGRLLDKANVHLARLSKRYKLASCLDASGIPTLDFELLDLYQCEARVSARQLSGGERFLVSLALALGLSDFRGIKMPVETLLLDEGFGTLDPDTLSTALSALGQLRADGRQVGIISHVVGLEERIDAQIRVTPLGAGRSKVVATVRG